MTNKAQPRIVGYFEDYRCGCVSEVVKRKRDLLGYCSTHGEDRRQIWPEIEWEDNNDESGD